MKNPFINGALARLFSTYMADEAEVCACCGDYMSNDNYKVCESCLDKETTYDNAKAYGEDNKAEVEINGFYAHAFTAEQIERILDRELKNSLSENEAAERYCHEYSYSFEDFLEKQYKKFEEER